MSAIQNAARALATWNHRPGGEPLPWEDMEPAFRALCQPPPAPVAEVEEDAEEETETPSVIVNHLRGQHRARRQALLRDLGRKAAAAAPGGGAGAALPPPAAPAAAHYGGGGGHLQRHSSLGMSVDAGRGESIGIGFMR